MPETGSLRQQAVGVAVCGKLHRVTAALAPRADPLQAMKLTIRAAAICSELNYFATQSGLKMKYED